MPIKTAKAFKLASKQQLTIIYQVQTIEQLNQLNWTEYVQLDLAKHITWIILHPAFENPADQTTLTQYCQRYSWQQFEKTDFGSVDHHFDLFKFGFQQAKTPLVQFANAYVNFNFSTYHFFFDNHQVPAEIYYFNFAYMLVKPKNKISYRHQHDFAKQFNRSKFFGLLPILSYQIYNRSFLTKTNLFRQNHPALCFGEFYLFILIILTLRQTDPIVIPRNLVYLVPSRFQPQLQRPVDMYQTLALLFEHADANLNRKIYLYLKYLLIYNLIYFYKFQSDSHTSLQLVNQAIATMNGKFFQQWKHNQKVHSHFTMTEGIALKFITLRLFFLAYFVLRKYYNQFLLA